MRSIISSAAWGVSELARELAVNPRTIRYYEHIGLLAASSRTHAGYRRYGTAERDRLRFILKAKTTGFSLENIRAILSLRDKGVAPCGHVLALIEDRLRQLEQHVQSLLDVRDELVSLRQEAADQQASERGGICRLLEHHQPQHDGATLRRGAQILARQPGDRRHSESRAPSRLNHPNRTRSGPRMNAAKKPTR